MFDLKRSIPRFEVNFDISANNITGKGLNISLKGLGLLTDEELIPAHDIPFKAEVKGFIFSNKVYKIEGVGNLLYSKKSKEYESLYYNGFEFTKFIGNGEDSLLELISDIRVFQKDIGNGVENKSLADFVYYPSPNLADKAEIFNSSIIKNLSKNYEMYSYHLKSGSQSTSNFCKTSSSETKEMIMMGSNNYLGLTMHPDVIKAGCDALVKYGSGNGSGAMVGGTFSIHKELEAELADFIGKEEVVIFNSGYSTNVGVISGLLRPMDAVINDQFNHASIFDGCELSGAKRLIYSHNDMDSLERILKRAELNYNGRLIVVNAVFSSSGEISNLKEITTLAKRHNCMVMVDEAHGFGILGEKGIGASEHLGVLNKVDLFMGTMSKSLAGVGGFVGAKREIIEYLRFYAHSYLFSTNIPPSTAASILEALRIIKRDPSIRERLWYNINYFRKGLNELGFNTGNSEAAVVPLYISDNKMLFNFSKTLFKKGVFHNVFTYPAVPMGASLLRFGIMATHTEKELEKALRAIEETAKETGLFPERRVFAGDVDDDKIVIKSYNSILNIDKSEWDSIVSKDQLLNSYDYLCAVEKSNINNFRYKYFMFYKNRKLICHAPVGIFRFFLDALATKNIKRVTSRIKKIFPKFLEVTFIESGFPSELGNAMCVADSESIKDILYLFDRELMRLAKKENTKFIVIRDINSIEKREYDYLNRFGYKTFQNFPNGYMRILHNSFDDYIKDLNSRHRREIKNKLSIFESDCRIEKIYDFKSISGEIETLWKDTYNHAKDYQREILNKDYFEYLSDDLKDKSFILAAKRGDKLIGFSLYYDSGESLIFSYCGLDYEENKKYYTYFVLFYKSVEEAIKMGKKRLELGVTSYETKLRIGGMGELLFAYGKGTTPFTNWYFVPFLNMMNTIPKLHYHEVFTADYYQKFYSNEKLTAKIENKDYPVIDINEKFFIISSDKRLTVKKSDVVLIDGGGNGMIVKSKAVRVREGNSSDYEIVFKIIKYDTNNRVFLKDILKRYKINELKYSS